jgi:lysozyme
MSDTPDVPDVAVNLATQFEGEVLHPYDDGTGTWSLGFGSIWDWRNDPPTRVTPDTPPIDDPTARAWMKRELVQAAEAVAADVKVTLTDNQRGALEDFVFNLGPGNFAASTLLRDLNACNYQAAAGQFELWDHAGGVELAGLLRRRLAEAALFQQPDAPTAT